MTFRRKRTGLPEDVPFPVTPFLDMAFQLLAFFILTFRAPSKESRLDLYLPTTPVALPQSAQARVRSSTVEETDLETDLEVKVEAATDGSIVSIRLGETTVPDVTTLELRLARYRLALAGESLRVRFVAPDSLKYEEAARLIGACSRAGVSSVKLSGARENPR